MIYCPVHLELLTQCTSLPGTALQASPVPLSHCCACPSIVCTACCVQGHRGECIPACTGQKAVTVTGTLDWKHNTEKTQWVQCQSVFTSQPLFCFVEGSEVMDRWSQRLSPSSTMWCQFWRCLFVLYLPHTKTCQKGFCQAYSFKQGRERYIG